MDSDAFLITDTWLTGSDSDHRIIVDVTPTGYTRHDILGIH